MGQLDLSQKVRIGSPLPRLEMLYSTLRIIFLNAKISLLPISRLCLTLTSLVQYVIELQLLLLLIMRKGTLLQEINGILLYSSVAIKIGIIAWETCWQEPLNQKEQDILSWAVAQLAARVRVSVVSLRLTACLILLRMSASGRFLPKRLQNTSQLTLVSFCLTFIMEAPIVIGSGLN